MMEEGDARQRRSFTSRKLDMLDAMSVDPELRGDLFRFAFRVMQHINSNSGLAWPSLRRIAAQMGISISTAKRHADRLVELGWLYRERPNRRGTYEYHFLETRMNMVLDAMQIRVEESDIDEENRAAGICREVAELTPRKPREVSKLDHSEVSKLDHSEVAELTPKHLSTNYLKLTPDSLGIEEEKNSEVNSYTKAKGGF